LLLGCLQLKPVDDLIDACEGEDAMFLSVTFRVANDITMVALEIFGKNIRVQDGFVPRLKLGTGIRRSAPFFVSKGDDLIKQSGILRATK
jgi:hypothetical protein